MNTPAWLVFPALLLLAIPGPSLGGGGITPEQIYQPTIDWKVLIGTWEVLPDDNPLCEKPKKIQGSSRRILMSLRKDGTCRIFNEQYPAGSDGLWTFEKHRMFISFPNADRLEYYVYGVKKGFMVTRSNGEKARHLLWSRVR